VLPEKLKNEPLGFKLKEASTVPNTSYVPSRTKFMKVVGVRVT